MKIKTVSALLLVASMCAASQQTIENSDTLKAGTVKLNANFSELYGRLPAGTVLGTTDTQTLTNKRVTARVATLTDAATVTPAVDSYDGGILTSLSQTTTFANPTGTPTDMQKYTVRIKSASSQTLAWGNQYRVSTDLAQFTSTTGSGKTDYFVIIWNAADSKWDVLAKNFGF